MWTTRLLITASVLLIAQDIYAELKPENGVTEHADNRVIVEIEITEKRVFYVDSTQIGFNREEAKALCESLNMTLVQFETEGERLSVVKWISDSPYSSRWFWTGAKRDAGNTTWYWQDTGAEIVDFHWLPGQPSMPDSVTSCLSFNFGGWDDEACLEITLQALCEMK